MFNDEDVFDYEGYMLQPDELDDGLPVRASMRKSLLKSFGRRKGLTDLWNSPRFDGAKRSRSAAYPCHKDYRGAKSKDYRPWQKAPHLGVSEVARYTQDELEIIAILEAEYLDEQFRSVVVDSIDDIPAPADDIYAPAGHSFFVISD